MDTEYYLHRNLSFAYNYWGHIGPAYKVSRFKWLVYKFLGYRATAVPAGTPEVEVLVQAAIEQGCHPTSYHVEQIRKNGNDYRI